MKTIALSISLSDTKVNLFSIPIFVTISASFPPLISVSASSPINSVTPSASLENVSFLLRFS